MKNKKISNLIDDFKTVNRWDYAESFSPAATLVFAASEPEMATLLNPKTKIAITAIPVVLELTNADIQRRYNPNYRKVSRWTRSK